MPTPASAPIPAAGPPNPPPPSPPTAPVLDNSAREILKGTLVPVQVTAAAGEPGGGIAKSGAIRQLALNAGDTAEVRDRLRDAEARVSEATFELLQAFEEPAVPALRPGLAAISRVPAGELAAFAEALLGRRAERLNAVDAARDPEASGRAAQAVNTAAVALRGLLAVTAPPVGVLNLERIEMVPVGIQRGELVATIPLAPGEETAVTHTEWSVTSKEFTTIVTDSLEEVSETGVTDNTDLAQSTSSQSQHSNQFNITGTVQGGIPIISGSSTTGFTAQGSESASASESVKHARTTTQKAASRSRREHKVTISTKTETGASETSTRMLRNPGKDPIRVDYFSLMRKWRVRLYRYGLRLTYDITVPEPGAAMRRAYADLEWLRAQQGPFEFDVKYSDITTDKVDQNGRPDPAGVPKYRWLADRHGVAVRPYPEEPTPLTVSAHVGTGGGWYFLDLEFDVPGGTRVREMRLDAQIGKDDSDDRMNFDVIGAHAEPGWGGLSGPLIIRDHKIMSVGSGVPYMAGFTGRHKVTFFFHHSEQVFAGLTVLRELTPEAVEQWRTDVWNTLYTAAQTRYFAQQQEIAARIAAIEERLESVDTLTLRREENDELMKCVLRFVLGPDFDFMPDDVLAAFTAAGVDLKHGIGFDGPGLDLSPEQWSVLRRHEDVIRFLNQAIEWENVVTFLYSYFWDVPPSWDFVRRLRHPDPNRQAFLRAGSARIVLTVRKGWEERWMRFAEGGAVDAQIPAPYLSIAKEIAAYDDRNYPGIPPANPGRAAVRLQDAVYTTCAADIAPSPNPVTIRVESSEGFVVGLPVVIDVEDDRRLQEAQTVTAIPGPTQITVARITVAHRGTQSPVPILQPGEKGALIAEWGEYTPSSGTDIAMTSNLTTIS
ncbi:hypothetical protein Ssi03_42010 [Sphaerisporangium siamense]|uniref:Uncharacterized protein n=1 Tax=Sphaerisporangium siamense TaxID=795645 RepID=A0A7W7DD47_9ACTN|nr:hypothetical protein [Sphaerisporangium siamense]MBB4704597.1 hypothetical protein [Sphaerisporangium siamense]GII86211.1 hypothetical protein Ssi03_42010 [Sphaerisporangium siamense]